MYLFFCRYVNPNMCVESHNQDTEMSHHPSKFTPCVPCTDTVWPYPSALETIGLFSIIIALSFS